MALAVILPETSVPFWSPENTGVSYVVTMRLTAVRLSGSGPESVVALVGDSERDETQTEESEELHRDFGCLDVASCETSECGWRSARDKKKRRGYERNGDGQVGEQI
jgi:hypothetical protein